MPVHRILVLLLLLVFPISDAFARIKLVTLPVRERVEIRLEHEQATLVEEERILPLVAGVNEVDFSWAGTGIDPSTLVFRVLPLDNPDAATGVEVLSVSYPPGEDALIWSVAATRSGPARIRISYLLGGLDRHFHYRAVADPEEQAMTLSRYVRIDNRANERFDEALIRTGYGEPFERPLERDTTTELLLGEHPGVTIDKTFTADPVAHGWLDRAQDKLNVPMHYVLRNSADHGLGSDPLPYGKARIFQQDRAGGQAFLGEDWGRFTPIDEELRLFLGLARDIGVQRRIIDNRRERIAGNLFRYEVVIEYRLENFRDRPSRLTLVEQPARVRGELYGNRSQPPEWRIGERTTLPEPPDTERSDQNRLVFHLDLPARDGDNTVERVHTLQLDFHNEW